MSSSTEELEDLLADDPAGAHAKLETLVAKGDPAAMYVLGIALYDGEGVEEDRTRCLELLERAVAAGHTQATHDLGCFYYYGYGFPSTMRDHPRAVALLQKSASAGHAPSMAFLGCMYENGEGVPLNLATARALFRQAAELGNELGRESLARLGDA